MSYATAQWTHPQETRERQRFCAIVARSLADEWDSIYQDHLALRNLCYSYSKSLLGRLQFLQQCPDRVLLTPSSPACRGVIISSVEYSEVYPECILMLHKNIPRDIDFTD